MPRPVSWRRVPPAGDRPGVPPVGRPRAGPAAGNLRPRRPPIQWVPAVRVWRRRAQSRILRWPLRRRWSPALARHRMVHLRTGHRTPVSRAGWLRCFPIVRRASSSPGGWPFPRTGRWPALPSAWRRARLPWAGSPRRSAPKRSRRGRCYRSRPAGSLIRWQARCPAHVRPRPPWRHVAGWLPWSGSACRRTAFWRRAWGRDRSPVPGNSPRGSRSPKSRHLSVA
jgi:hypothetical protein